jgi:hypothetical protein
MNEEKKTTAATSGKKKQLGNFEIVRSRQVQTTSMSWLRFVSKLSGPDDADETKASGFGDDADDEVEDGNTSDSDDDSETSEDDNDGGRDESSPSERSRSDESDDEKDSADDDEDDETSVATIDHIRESVDAAHFEIGQLGNNLHSRIDDLETAIESLSEAIESLNTRMQERNNQRLQERLAEEREQAEMDRGFMRDARSHFIAMLARDDAPKYFLSEPMVLDVLKNVMFLNSL